ncbi:MAG TPA: Holliday junction resolvase-like protein [Vicinamibacteria bacterium]|nr:Holliday junction resolvase-like protein [Vicinamibacteria bacterium]
MMNSLTLVLLLIIAVQGYLLLRLKIREARIREDALWRSHSVVAGKATEHLAPLLPGFEFDPRDARFLGSPIDFIVFDGLSEGEVHEIAFVEIKTGPSAALTTRERRVRDAVDGRRVRFLEVRIDPSDRM